MFVRRGGAPLLIAASLLAFGTFAGQASAQSPALTEVSVRGGEAIQVGQRLRGSVGRRIGAHSLSFELQGRAGDEIHLVLESNATTQLMLIVQRRPSSQWALSAPQPILVAYGSTQSATVTLDADGRYDVRITEIAVSSPGFDFTLDVLSGPQGASPGPGGAPPREPGAPIIIAEAGEAPPAAPTRPSAPSLETTGGGSLLGGGPIILAEAPPPPAPVRRLGEGSGQRPSEPAPPPAEGSREARMLAQVERRRVEAAAEAEAERQRQAEAERARQEAERRRREQERQAEADRQAFWGGLMQGALIVGQAYADATAERAAQQAELNRLALAAAEETRQRQQAEADAQRIRDIEHARRATEAQLAQRQASDAADAAREARASQDREQAERDAVLAAQQREREQREAAARREAEERAAEQRRQEEARRAEAEARARREAEARAAEQRVQAERQRRMAQNASGSFTNVGLPPIQPGATPPGSGQLSMPVTHIGGCQASNVTVSYNLNILLGDATVAGSWAWTGEDGCTAPSTTEVWLRLQHGSAYGWVAIDGTVPGPNRGPGYNSTGSPDWNQLVCGFNGGARAGCMDAESARRLWAHGQVVGFAIGW